MYFTRAHHRSPGRTELRLLKGRVESPGNSSRNPFGEGRCRTGKLISDSREGRAIPDLCGSGVFPTEPFPRCRHHPAEPLLLCHIVTASTLSWRASRERRRRRSRHNSGLASGGRHQVKGGKLSASLGSPSLNKDGRLGPCHAVNSRKYRPIPCKTGRS